MHTKDFSSQFLFQTDKTLKLYNTVPRSEVKKINGENRNTIYFHWSIDNGLDHMLNAVLCM